MRAVDRSVVSDADDTGLAAKRTESIDCRDLMPHGGKGRHQFGANIFLDLQAVAAVRECAAEQKARACKGGSGIKAVIDQQAEQQRQRLWLAVRPLRPIDQMRSPVLQRKTWIERI